MTAVITLERDQERGTHSMCATRLSFKTTDADANGKDYCPGCSGSTTARQARRVAQRRRKR